MSKKAAELQKKSAESTTRAPRVTTAKQPTILRADTTKKRPTKYTPPRGIGGRFTPGIHSDEAAKSHLADHGKK
jgi:hypothetical protein